MMRKVAGPERYPVTCSVKVPWERAVGWAARKPSHFLSAPLLLASEQGKQEWNQSTGLPVDLLLKFHDHCLPHSVFLSLYLIHTHTHTHMYTASDITVTHQFKVCVHDGTFRIFTQIIYPLHIDMCCVISGSLSPWHGTSSGCARMLEYFVCILFFNFVTFCGYFIPQIVTSKNHFHFRWCCASTVNGVDKIPLFSPWTSCTSHSEWWLWFLSVG